MKKLISSTLAVTMLVTPLVGSECFADKVDEPRMSYVQNEKRSEKFKFKNHNLRDSICKNLKKILPYIAAGALASIAIFKLSENFLSESNKSKSPFLFTKETQEDNEIIGAEVEKDEIIKSLVSNSTTSAIADNITNNTTGTNNTNGVSGLKNSFASSAKELAIGTGVLLCSVFLYLFCQRAAKNFERATAKTAGPMKEIAKNAYAVTKEFKTLVEEKQSAYKVFSEYTATHQQ